MFFINQSKQEQDSYIDLLSVIGALSKLSSDSNVPYLYYRMAENIFCKAFGAENLARSDISLDAKKDHVGLGLKTFVCKGACSTEKIAEFNESKHFIDEANSLRDKVNVIASLRNERLETTGGICDIALDDMYYHCVARRAGKFLIHETPIKKINIKDIGAIHENKNIISFSDGIYDYSFNSSKSTLYKKFVLHPICEMDIDIYDDPYALLEKLIKKPNVGLILEQDTRETIVLPLYSERGENHVPEKSGLNQWNASGRARDYDEVYIPIPRFIYNIYPDFFPGRDKPFKLKLPGGRVLEAKVCQDGGKALMSNPNKDLGQWLLRDVMHLQPGELLTYTKLEHIGIDSVEITKINADLYEINFKRFGSFEEFKQEHNLEER
jgi:hypothetical protein